MGEAILTLNELVLTFGGLHVCVQFGENRRRNATVRVSTDGQTHTHTRTDTKRFYYLSHAICYSYGADNNAMSSVGELLQTATHLPQQLVLLLNACSCSLTCTEEHPCWLRMWNALYFLKQI